MNYHRVKHLVTDITCIAEDTGYSYEFLCEQVDDLIADGESLEEAVEQVRDISYEQDW